MMLMKMKIMNYEDDGIHENHDQDEDDDDIDTINYTLNYMMWIHTNMNIIILYRYIH